MRHRGPRIHNDKSNVPIRTSGTHAFCSVLFLIIALTEQKKEKKKEDEEYREEWAILFPQQKLKTRILVQERGESNLLRNEFICLLDKTAVEDISRKLIIFAAVIESWRWKYSHRGHGF